MSFARSFVIAASASLKIMQGTPSVAKRARLTENAAGWTPSDLDAFAVVVSPTAGRAPRLTMGGRRGHGAPRGKAR